MDVIVRLPNTQSGYSENQATFLEPLADKKTRNYYIECWNHYPPPINPKAKGIEP